MSADNLINSREKLLDPLRGPYVVDEWDGHIPEVWARTFTIKKRQGIERFLTNDDPEGYAECVYRYALDKNGNRLFSNRGQREFLFNQESDVVIQDLGLWIMGRSYLPGEEPVFSAKGAEEN